MESQIKGLDLPEFYNQTAALNNLIKIDPDTGLYYAILELKDAYPRVRRDAVIICLQSENKKVIEPLREVLDDEDIEVRFFAKQAIKIIESKDR